MNYRNLGKSGLKVSEIGLGSWLTYGGATQNAMAESCIDRAYELGVNFFDTANAYAGGEAERVVGRALAKFVRSSYVLATKVFFNMGSGPNDRGLSRKHILEQCHASLKRLDTDYIDLYQCHRFDDQTPVEETLVTLDDLCRQGKILYYGVSEWRAPQIADAVAITRHRGLHPLVSNQPQYSMLARSIDSDVIPLCESEGLGQVCFSPLAQGVLTGKYLPGQPPPEGSRAADPKQNPFFESGVLDAWVHDKIAANDALLERVQRLVPIATDAGITMPQLALAWCLRQKSVASVIVGASRPDQVDANVSASGIALSPATLAKIEQVLAQFLKSAMKILTLTHLVVALWLLVATAFPAGAGLWQYSATIDSVTNGEIHDHPRAYMWMPPKCRHVRAVVVAQHNLLEESILLNPRFRRTLEKLDMAEVWIMPNIDYVFDFHKGAGDAFDDVMKSLAAVSGYGELATAPIVPMGHSAAASYPWNFAAWAPSRTFAMLSVHGDMPQSSINGSHRPNPDWGTSSIDGIPGLFVMGQYEWWDKRYQPGLDYVAQHPGTPLAMLPDIKGSGNVARRVHRQSAGIAARPARRLHRPEPWHREQDHGPEGRIADQDATSRRA